MKQAAINQLLKKLPANHRPEERAGIGELKYAREVQASKDEREGAAGAAAAAGEAL
ncbi:hypothetical protein CHLRE_10g434983v5 [Chlamydomonas reinhardtii]|uniref:Uncharacterized protein n=1 Tax=Chlamydomonas reinhardtii TaxID=3055 RepID=A0A2K3DA46_CHLRE|nr:uncharacterized protein CHLRE_10g434983v5 [Chlamydomonas reinhardtii]PNW77402.1 hypothetical protein CHLRE_10g434983v5 [Chlamydomonas reinhardtii]